MGRKAGVTVDETRAALLEAAAEVFAEQGYEKASVAAITARAGLSSGTVYSHFGSKRELFFATCEEYGQLQMNPPPGEPGSFSVAEFYLHVLMSQMTTPSRSAALQVEALLVALRDPEVAERVFPEIWRRYAEQDDLIAAAQQGGLIDSDIDPHALGMLTTVMGHGILLTRALNIDPTTPVGWEDLMRRLIGLWAPDPSEPSPAPAADPPAAGDPAAG